MVPGEYDIGRWCRTLESAFLIKKDVGKINIHRGDDFLYVKFHTDENIQLKKFFYTKELDEIVTSCISSRMFKGNCDGSRKDMPLEYYYNMFYESKIRTEILKHIKNNLME